MHPLLLLIPGSVCLIVAVYGVLELVTAIADGVAPRRAATLLALLSLPIAGTAITVLPPALWLAEWVIGGAP